MAVLLTPVPIETKVDNPSTIHSCVTLFIDRAPYFLSGTYAEQPGIIPPSCTTPLQPTIYECSLTK